MRKKLLWLMVVGIAAALAVAGVYSVRLRSLEKQMSAAMDKHDMATVTELAYCFPCPVNARSKGGWSPLHCAAWKCDLEMVNRLLGKGADVNAKDRGNMTPLHLASFNGYTEVPRHSSPKALT